MRFFGGWDYPDDLCRDPKFVDIGYQQGVPMGSDLTPLPAENARPHFAVMAMKDPNSDLDARLQRIQIVKGWIDEKGELQEMVYEVVSDPPGGPFPRAEDYVDLTTCNAKSGIGQDTLCTVWEDTDFDPSQSAFYYARVLQNPTCRWSTLQCLALKQTDPKTECWEWLDTPANLEAGKPGVTVGYTLQERAWTSSIWYEPKSGN